jgi:ketosteroid isomerase-like protein
MRTRLPLIAPLMAISCVSLAAGTQTCKNNVAALDNEFQAATKRNDAATIDRLLPSDYILVSDTGEVQTKADLVNEAREKKYQFSHQEDSHQTVRIWGDTAVLTARLWAEGTTDGRHFNVKIWFSDTYACTPQGWRYVLGQVGTPIPSK